MAELGDHSRDLYLSMPKIELHAHINASISDRTIKTLLSNKGMSQNHNLLYREGDTTTLKNSFEKFKLIHKLSDNAESAYFVTKEVIKEFAAENVKYLELRSTPRAATHTGMTKECYIESVLRAIDDCKVENQEMIVKLLLSIDRRNGTDVAKEIVNLAEKYRSNNGNVIGIDLSGDPEVGDAIVYVPCLQDAKNRGLKLALHIAEVPSNLESMELLKLLPDRIGHGTCLHPEAGGTTEIVDFVLKYQIPIEVCPTSNYVCQTVKNFADHHFKYWFKKKHPCVVCTDGKGVFNTSLSKEYSIIADTFQLRRRDVLELAYNSISHILGDENTKQNLREIFSSEAKKIQEL